MRGPLSGLLKKPFLTSFVLKANFCALALNAPSDQGNSFAILPGGVLVLSLDRESFQVSGEVFQSFWRVFSPRGPAPMIILEMVS